MHLKEKLISTLIYFSFLAFPHSLAIAGSGLTNLILSDERSIRSKITLPQPTATIPLIGTEIGFFAS